MAGVFLSHSSHDKQLILTLAADLVSRGIPVWLDSWEMETGDSLYQRLFDGLDESTFLILALSPHAVVSKWVKKELNAALAKEDKLRRKVILPIKLAECEVPLAIADRLYADFTTGYLAALERLETVLKRLGATAGCDADRGGCDRTDMGVSSVWRCP
jgi:TIR domain